MREDSSLESLLVLRDHLFAAYFAADFCNYCIGGSAAAISSPTSDGYRLSVIDTEGEILGCPSNGQDSPADDDLSLSEEKVANSAVSLRTGTLLQLSYLFDWSSLFEGFDPPRNLMWMRRSRRPSSL